MHETKPQDSHAHLYEPMPLSRMKVLIVCRGPIAEEALRVIREMGIAKPDLVVSRQEWYDTLESRAPWLSDRSRFDKVHRLHEYSDIEAIIKIAQTNHIDAIYVGYGFLAENPQFARRCEQSGLRFIGPTSDILHKIGSKEKSRLLAEKLEIPVVPGISSFAKKILAYGTKDDGEIWDNIRQKASQLDLANDALSSDMDVAVEQIVLQAQRQDFVLFNEEEMIAAVQRETEQLWQKHGKRPTRIKASAGGGGKGQRVITDIAEISKALREVWSEIGASQVSNKAVIIELNITGARHLEVQVLGDGENVVHFGVRDCSFQTMFYQKLVEIGLHEGQITACQKALPADSPLHKDLSQEAAVIRNLQNAAVKLTKSIGYRGAGTVEFLVDENYQFYFLEVNARIQVEHGVSEEIAKVRGERVSLVAQQICIASGQKLGFTQEDITFAGYAIETRISLLDSTRLRPAPGALLGQLTFAQGPGIRLEDSGMERALGQHRQISPPPAYDANITLNIYSGSDWKNVLSQATENLRLAQVHGKSLLTTIPFHMAVLTWLRVQQPHPRVTTAFVPTYLCVILRLQERLAALKVRLDELVAKTKKNPYPWQTVAVEVFSRLAAEPNLAVAFFLEKGNSADRQPLETLAEIAAYLQLALWPEDRHCLREAGEFFQSLKELCRKVQIATEILLQGLKKNSPEIAALTHLIADVEKRTPEQAVAALQKKYQSYHDELVNLITDLFGALRDCELPSLCRESAGTRMHLPKSLENEDVRKRLLAQGEFTGRSGQSEEGLIVAPVLGIYYRSPKPGMPFFVELGQRVRKGQTLCLVGAMKVYSELQSPYEGTVTELLTDNEVLVKPGQKLMRIVVDKAC